jgi:uncharacterized protein YcbK (DUF882 family)
MQMSENNNTRKNKKPYIALGAVGVVLLVVSVLYFVQNREMTAIVENLNEEKTILTEEYQNLMVNYDSLYSDNDTLNLMLEVERERISQLVEEIKTIKATNTAKIREFQKELTTLRSVLRNYIVQIDSLNLRNMELTEENLEHRRRYTQIASSYRELEEVKTNLEEKVTIASRLDVTNMMAEGLAPSGRKTNRSGRIGKIRVCFTLLKNVTSPIGMKEFFLRIERPDGQLLMHSRDNTFEHEGSEINYSATRSVEYGGEELDVCLFYEVDAGELIAGEYIADIFADGFHIKSLRFSLR